MKVVAIDPGYDRVGVAVLDNTNGTDQLVFSTCIITNRTASFPERLLAVGMTIEHVLAEHQPQAVAIETLFFNKNVKTAIGVAQARGIIIYLALRQNCQVFEFGPQEIKVAVTGHGNSDKTAVITMIKRLIKNAPGTAHDDEYDAIAVGITCLAHYGRGQYNPVELRL